MPISTNVPRAAAYIEDQALLFDTCAFTWFAKTDDNMTLLGRVTSQYRILVPTPVLYELAFGSNDLVNNNESKIWNHIHDPTKCVDISNYIFAQRQKRIPKIGIILINPGFNEWWTARTRLLEYISISGA